MRLIRFLAAIFAFCILLIFAAVVFWFFLGGKSLVRHEIVKRLRPIAGETFDITSLDIYPHSITLGGIKLDPSSTLHLHIRSVTIRMSLYDVITGGLDWQGALEEIEIIEPRLTIVSSPSASKPKPKSKGLEYKPFALRKLGVLKLIRRIRIDDGSVASEGMSQLLVEDINGQLDFTDPTHTTLNISALMPNLEAAELKLDGNADISVGTFLAVLKIDIPELTGWPLPKSMEKLEIQGGRFSCELQAWGDEDLRFSGDFQAEEIGVVYDQKLFVEDASLGGSLFGQRVEALGSANVNGNSVEYAATIEDLFRAIWELKAKSDIDLEQLQRGTLSLPDMKGSVALSTKLTGVSGDWKGEVEASSEGVEIAGISVLSPEIKIMGSPGWFVVEKISGVVEGVSVNLAGEFDSSFAAIDLRGEFTRSWSGNETPVWAAFPNPLIRGSLGISMKEGLWYGGGEGGIYDGAGKQRLGFQLVSENESLILNLIPAIAGSGDFRLILTPKAEPLFRLKTRDPHKLLAGVLKETYLPDGFNEYIVSVTSEGTLESISATLIADANNPPRSARFNVEIVKDKEGWKGEINSQLRLPDRSRLSGSLTGRYTSEAIEIERGVLDLDQGEELITIKGKYSIIERKLEWFHLEGEDIPIIQFMMLLNSNIEPGLHGLTDISADGAGDSLIWSTRTDITYPDQAMYVVRASGKLNRDVFILYDATLKSNLGDSTFLSAKGGYKFSDGGLENAEISFRRLQIERAIEILFPDSRGKFAGVVNAHIEADGELLRPKLVADVHIISGMLFGEPGYWANASVTGDSGRYEIGHVSFGQNLEALFSGSGLVDLEGGAEKFRAIGQNVEIGKIIRGISGVNLPLAGRGDFELLLEGADGERQVIALVRMGPGAFGPLKFDNINSRLHLDGLGAGIPSLVFDTLQVWWKDAHLDVTGELPLTPERTIDIGVHAEGDLPNLLTNISGFFSEPEGAGTLDAKVGGTIRSFSVIEARLALNDVGFSMSQVFRRVDQLNVDITLDSEKRIRIAKFEGRVGGEMLRVGIREPETGETTIMLFGYDLGIIQIQTSNDGIWVVIPGLMEPEWGGSIRLNGWDGQGPFELRGPAESPKAVGEARIRNAIFTYPPIPGKGKPTPFTTALLELLKRIDWDARIIPERGNRYFREISGLGKMEAFDDLSDRISGGLFDPDIKLIIDARLDDDREGLRFEGAIAERLHIGGEVTSSAGSVEFLDLRFQIEKAGIRFNPADIEPVIYGSAATTVIDSGGIARQVRIRLGTSRESRLDPKETTGARFGDLTVALEDDQGHSQEAIMAMLGYAPAQLPGKFGGLGGELVESATPLRRWQRVFERRMERFTGLDRVALETTVTKNLIERQFNPVTPTGGTDVTRSTGSWNLLYGSRLTLGKYLDFVPGLYVSYTGLLASPTETYTETHLGVQHDWDALYRLTPISNNLVLNYRYEYNELARSSANSIVIRYGIVFSLQNGLKNVKW